MPAFQLTDTIGNSLHTEPHTLIFSHNILHCSGARDVKIRKLRCQILCLATVKLDLLGVRSEMLTLSKTQVPPSLILIKITGIDSIFFPMWEKGMCLDAL